MDQKSALLDARVAKIAGRQHGVVSIQQLREAGLSETAVRNRVRAGRLHRLHRGVYAVGHRSLSVEGRWMAALLAFDGAAVISYRSAATVWELLPSTEGPVDISIPSQGGRRQRRGIRLHRCESLGPGHMTKHRGIAVTTPARTIADLRRVVAPENLRRAIRQAEVLGLRIEMDAEPDRTRSELERRFLRLCRRYHLPQPQVNVRVGRLTVDFLWPERRLIVETDGYRFHRGRQAFEDDRSRDLALRGLGFEVLRLSYRQVFEEPGRIAGVLRDLLVPGAR